MQKVTCTVGLPGAGKSTWAKAFVEKNPDWVRVNRDDFRNMRGKYWLPKQEDLITDWEVSCAVHALIHGYNVIIDATNFRVEQLQHKIQKVFTEEGGTTPIQFETKFFDTPLKECIKRDLQRPNSVGKKVIMMMYYKYVNIIKTIFQDKTLPNAIICDLDGTIAIHKDRNAYEYHKCNTDIVNPAVQKILHNYLSYGQGEVLFVSARPDSAKDMTIEWLKSHLQLMEKEVHLFMRKTGDNRQDSIVKKEIFDANIKDKYFVEFILDDRDQVVEMWRALGLTCLQVADGDF